MTGPQLEHGYVKVARGWLEMWSRSEWVNREGRIVFAWMLHCYDQRNGGTSTVWRTNISRIHAVTGLRRPSIRKALEKLGQQGLMQVVRIPPHTLELTLLKDPARWLDPSARPTPLNYRKTGSHDDPLVRH